MKNRYLFWFCISYIAAAIFSAVFKSFLAVSISTGAFVAITALFLSRAGARKSAALVVVGITLSLVWQSFYFRNDAISPQLLTGDATLDATVVSFSEMTETSSNKFRVKILDKEKEIKLQVYFSGDEVQLSPGDKVRITANIVEYKNTKYFAQKTYYKSRHTDAVAFASSVEYLGREDDANFYYLPEYLAYALKQKADSLFSEEHSAFIKSLILGDTDGLGKDFKENLRRSGLSHTVAVSGMHISFLIGFLIFFTKNRYLKLLAIPMMFCFAVMVGAPQSALRAVIMQTLLVLADATKREYDSLTAISFAAAVLVFINPYCVTDVGFLLSFLASLGIILLQPRIFRWISSKSKNLSDIPRKVLNALGAAFAVTISAVLFTVPISAYFFDSFSVIAPVSNVLLGFFIMLIFTGGCITLLLSFVFYPLGKVVAIVLSSLIELVMNIIRMISKIPFSEMFTGDTVVFLSVCFLCFVAVYSILSGKKRVRPWFAIGVSLVAIICVFAFKFAFPSDTKEGIRFDVLDVGQGQCIVATSGDECAVIDCGGDDADDIAISHLLSRGISDIDALVLTHAHADHANGTIYLTDTIDTEKVYMPKSDSDNATFIRLAENVGWENAVFVSEDMKISLGDMEVELITLPGGKDENENGLVAIVRDGEYEFLITGDIPSKLEKLIVDKVPDCEAYILGHHGSKSSSSQELLNKALPEMCVISVGADNSYGHPNSAALSRVKQFTDKIYRTDIDGTLTFYSR